MPITGKVSYEICARILCTIYEKVTYLASLQKLDGPLEFGCAEFDSHEVHTPKVFISLCNALIQKSY